MRCAARRMSAESDTVTRSLVIPRSMIGYAVANLDEGRLAGGVLAAAAVVVGIGHLALRPTPTQNPAAAKYGRHPGRQPAPGLRSRPRPPAMARW